MARAALTSASERWKGVRQDFDLVKGCRTLSQMATRATSQVGTEDPCDVQEVSASGSFRQPNQNVSTYTRARSVRSLTVAVADRIRTVDHDSSSIVPFDVSSRSIDSTSRSSSLAVRSSAWLKKVQRWCEYSFRALT